MESSRLLKKPKLEDEAMQHDGNDDQARSGVNGSGRSSSGGKDGEEQEQEEALIALIEHRTKECRILKKKLEEAEKRLAETKAKLAHLRVRSKPPPAPSVVVEEGGRSSPVSRDRNNQDYAQPRPPLPQQSSRPQLVLPPHNTKTPSLAADARGGRSAKPELKVSSGAGNRTNPSSSALPNGADNKPRTFPEKGMPIGSQEKRSKRKPEQKEHQDLIRNIRTSSSPCKLGFQAGTLISSQHKRKLRCLEICPMNDHLFVTSALDGIVNLWQVQGKGSNASLLSTVDCLSPKQRRWPEDIAWHPDGDSIFAAYTADGGESQISVLNLNASREKKVTFLDRKPHNKGIINSIMFTPWVDTCFTTGGSDHAVVLWQESDDSWKPKTIHGTLHSSAVMGVAGLYQKKTVLSAGADKRVIAFDLLSGRSEFKNLIESKCMSVLPNPSDFNLFMVQTGEPGKQLRLFDVRLRQTEVHAFGWKQEASESQSALINQAWSPDGLYLSSGSADPMIHLFDIRFDARKPSQSVHAHQKRVFKAVWHQSLPLLTSISSDLNIGLHKTC